jgi:carbon dioxide concentrating mechanism protein CcmN
MNLLPAMTPIDRPAVISGNVSVHPTANIASGVLLHADPDSQLIIGAGVCVGWGCVIHAHAGILSIGDGAILGMGALVIGICQIGEHACIGSASSLMNVVIAAHSIVPPNSLVDEKSSNPIPPVFEPVPMKPKPKVESVTTGPTPLEFPPNPPPVAAPAAPIVLSINAPVYGKAGLERLLATLRNEKPDLK